MLQRPLRSPKPAAHPLTTQTPASNAQTPAATARKIAAPKAHRGATGSTTRLDTPSKVGLSRSPQHDSPRQKPSDSLSLRDLEFYANDWLQDCECRQHTAATLEWRRRAMKKLFWFLTHHGHQWCGTSELRSFLVYLTRGHEESAGRWGNPRFNRPVSARTVKDYHGCLRTLFNWMVTDGVITTSPMTRIASPVSRADQIQPFTTEQVMALLQAARESRESLRNEAILLLAIDVGLRATELCTLRMKDIDINNRMCRVLGKGNKHRSLYFGRATAKALWRYLREEDRQAESPVFCSFFGKHRPLDRNGFRLLMRRLGQAADIQAVRCSPHTLRHTFAISFLRAGGNIWSLKEILGHTQLQQTMRYAAIAEADVEAQQRMFSPSDRLLGK